MTALNRFGAPLAAAVIGASFCIWLVGFRLVDPTEIDWLMKTDWNFQFLGWHHFRNEPWQWPPGLLRRYHLPVPGTAIGYTDSIPLAAFALKPLSPWLPMPFQYTGLWWVLCFAMQGLFGALLIRVWSKSVITQLLGAGLFVLTPTLINRFIHPGLCAHWLILWALWLYFQPNIETARLRRHLIALAASVGLIHPYLAAMVLVLLTAVVVHQRRAFLALGISLGVVLMEWWLSGLFLVPPNDLAMVPGDNLSTNLLAIVTPSGWSRFSPPGVVNPGPGFEGLHYMGAGSLLVVLVGVCTCVIAFRRLSWRGIAPLAVATGLLAVYSFGPRVTLGSQVIVDYSALAVERLPLLRTTGRFFWPAGYTLLLLALAMVVKWLPNRVSTSVLAVGLVFQAADLEGSLAQRRQLARDPRFLSWPGKLTSPVWAAALPHYDQIVLFLPLECGGAPTTFDGPSYLAGLYRISVNASVEGRWSEKARAAYCQTLGDDLMAGRVDDRSIYLVHRPYEPLIRKNAPHLVCGDIDQLLVCVTSRSYQYWRNAADLH